MNRISWYTPPIGDSCGFGYAAVCLIHALQRKGYAVDHNNTTNPVHISWVQPEWYEGEPHQYKIGYTPWESTGIPKSWPKYMNRMDEIWTTSTFCKDIYDNDERIEKIATLVPHGIEPDDYPITERIYDRRGYFTFLHVGGPTERKGAQRVFDAFLDLFDGDNKYQLVLKCNGYTECRYWDGGNFKSAADHPQVRIIPAELPIAEMYALYKRVNCLVYPTNGEGFGLIPFQGIATGLPTIATNGTALSDYMHLSLPLNYTWTEGQGVHLGQWMEPSDTHLRELMTHVTENFEAEHERALKGAEWIHNNLTWDHVADHVIKLIGDKF